MNKAQLLNKENWLAYLERANEEELTRNAIANDIVAKIAEALELSKEDERDQLEAFRMWTSIYLENDDCVTKDTIDRYLKSF